MELRKILRARPKGLSVECEMENGEVYLYDMSFVNKETGPMVTPLREKDFFEQVFIELGCITWPNGYCIDGDSVAIDGKLISSPRRGPAEA